MFRKMIVSFVVIAAAVSSTAVHAQKVEGTYLFPQKIMLSPDGPPQEAEAKLVVTVMGDSVHATWRVAIPGRDTKPKTLRGTLKGNTMTLFSGTEQARLQGDGGERTIDVHHEYVLTVNGDVISGELSPISSDSNVQMPSRTLTGKRGGG